MASSAASQRELEEKLTQSGIMLSTPPSSTRELLVLLLKVESELKSVGQEPSLLIRTAVDPIKNALSKTNLLEHSNEAIEVCVVSCICEIMRISAPRLPYDADKMKEIFLHITMVLQKLPNVVSSCYFKVASVLDRLEKFRMCVMLLDIDYLSAMGVFQLFPRIIRSYHPHRVFTNMVDIMTQLIEESDEVSSDLLLPLLECLRKKAMDVAPLASLLGHKVFKKCVARLKPFLLEATKTGSLNFDDYTDVLSLTCHEVPEGENKVQNAGVESPDTPLEALKLCDQAEQLKDTDTQSDPVNKNTKDLQQQIALCGQSEEIRPNKEQSGMNESESCVEEATENKEDEKKSGSSSENPAPMESDLASETGENPTPMESALPSETGENPTPMASALPSETGEQAMPMESALPCETEYKSTPMESELPTETGNQPMPEATKNKEHEKKSGSSSENPTRIESDFPSETGKQSMADVPTLPSETGEEQSTPMESSFPSEMGKQCSSGSSRKRGRPRKNQSAMPSETGEESMPDVSPWPSETGKQSSSGSSRKRGRPKKNQSAMPSETGEQSMPDVSALPSDTGKQSSSGSSRKRGRPKKNQSPITTRESSVETRSSKGKRARHLLKNEDSPSSAVMIKKEEEILPPNDLQNTSKRITRSSKKQSLTKEKDSTKCRFSKEYALVGSKVRVWWPVDTKFYEGVITRFDPKTKRHKVVYTDGDEELLNLNNERWEMVHEVSVKEEPVDDFSPQLSVAAGKKKAKDPAKEKESGASSSKRSGKKAQESGNMPGKSIKSGKSPTKDSNTTKTGRKLRNRDKSNPRIKVKDEEVTEEPSETFSEVGNSTAVA